MSGAGDRLGPELHLLRLAAAAEEAARDVAPAAEEYARRVIRVLQGGGRLFFCGNGGSAATVEHVATEYVVRLRRNRTALPALSLTASTSTLTAAANDLGFEHVFARALHAHARSGDLLVLHSTSGDSPNLIAAARAAARMAVETVALLGRTGGALQPLVDLAICVPSADSTCVQELHLAIEHSVVDRVEGALGDSTPEADE